VRKKRETMMEGVEEWRRKDMVVVREGWGEGRER